MAYDHSDHSQHDAEALKRRRVALRAFVEEVAESVRALQLPETYLEAERAARAVYVADRMAQKLPPVREEEKQDTPPPPKMAVPLPTSGAEKEEEEKAPTDLAAPHTASWSLSGVNDSLDRLLAAHPMNGEGQGKDLPPPSRTSRDTSPADAGEDENVPARDPVRLHLRTYADRVMEAATFIPKPECFLEGERAGRYAAACERMLTQLYAPPPKPKPTRFDETDEDTPNDTFDPHMEFVAEEGLFRWQIELEAKLNRLAKAQLDNAAQTGFWEDGRPFIAEAPYSNRPSEPEPDPEDEPLEPPFNTPALDPQAEAMPRSGGRFGYYAPRSQPP